MEWLPELHVLVGGAGTSVHMSHSDSKLSLFVTGSLLLDPSDVPESLGLGVPLGVVQAPVWDA